MRSVFKAQYNFTQFLQVFYTIDVETCCQINDITFTNYVNGNVFLLLPCLIQMDEERKKKKERNFQTQNAQPVAWHSAGFQVQATYKYLSSTTNYYRQIKRSCQSWLGGTRGNSRYPLCREHQSTYLHYRRKIRHI